MVYHFEAQKFLHVCIPQHERGKEEVEGERERERAQSKGTEGQKGKKRKREGVQREDLSHKVEQKKK